MSKLAESISQVDLESPSVLYDLTELGIRVMEETEGEEQKGLFLRLVTLLTVAADQDFLIGLQHYGFPINIFGHPMVISTEPGGLGHRVKRFRENSKPGDVIWTVLTQCDLIYVESLHNLYQSWGKLCPDCYKGNPLLLYSKSFQILVTSIGLIHPSNPNALRILDFLVRQLPELKDVRELRKAYDKAALKLAEVVAYRKRNELVVMIMQRKASIKC